MKEAGVLKIDRELFEETGITGSFNLVYLSAPQLHKHLMTSVYLRSTMFILVLNGNADIEINFKKFEVSSQKIMLLSFGHFFKIERISTDFKCIVLYVSKDYIEEMYSTDMVYKRVKYGVKMHKLPLLELQAEESSLLHQRLRFIDDILLNRHHRYFKELVLHALLIFFLDLSNIIEQDRDEGGTGKPNRDEIYFQQFLDYLVLHYKRQHKVNFYAEKLNITTHYLTLIVKRLSGQSVSDLIFELIFSEAKVQLKQPALSIQQIAEELSFSDQSSFGKFFKRKSGLSPKEFRQRMIK